MSGIQIVGMGHALPVTEVTNIDLEKIVETSDEWIRSRSGIGSRRTCTGDESLVKLAVSAAEEAVQKAGIAVEDIGMIITATCTAGFQIPSVACIVQKELGIPSGIPAFDINVACAGFIYGLQLIHALMNQNPTKKYALLIGVEQISNILDYSDRSTCVLFGDGAGAAIIRMSEEKKFFCHIGAEGDTEALYVENIEADTDRSNFAREKERISHLHMDGRKVFRFATSKIAEEIENLQELSGVAVENIDHVICHQANKRIIDHVRKKWKLPEEKFYMNLDRFGNTSAASVPLAIYEMIEQGRIKEGDRAFCVGFGAGLTWGGAYLEF